VAVWRRTMLKAEARSDQVLEQLHRDCFKR